MKTSVSISVDTFMIDPEDCKTGAYCFRFLVRMSEYRKKLRLRNKANTSAHCYSSHSIRLDRNNNPVEHDDPRWTSSKYMSGTRYLRSQEALENPITEQELDLMLPDQQLRYNSATIARTRWEYEAEIHHNRLINFRRRHRNRTVSSYAPTPPTFVLREEFDREQELDYTTRVNDMDLPVVRKEITLFRQSLTSRSLKVSDIQPRQERIAELLQRETDILMENTRQRRTNNPNPANEFHGT